MNNVQNIKLSIGMIIKNEEEYLEECLKAMQSLRDGVVSELIIVDTGSTDHSVGIAKKFTDKVYHYEWKDNFSDARNYVLEKATGEWYLQIDADEIFQNTEPLVRFLNSTEERNYNDAAYIKKNYLNKINSRLFTEIWDYRLFRIEKNRSYRGIIHEAIKVIGPTYYLDIYVIHYGYVENNRVDGYQKSIRNLRLLKKEIENYPNDPRIWYHIAQEYFAIDNKEKAIEAGIRAINAEKDSNYNRYSTKAYWLMALLYFKSKKYHDTILTVKEYENAQIPVVVEYIDLVYVMIDAMLEIEEYQNALIYFKKLYYVLQGFRNDIKKGDNSKKIAFSSLDDLKKEELICKYSKALIKVGKTEEAIGQLTAIKGSGGKAMISVCAQLWIDVLRKEKNGLSFYKYYNNMTGKKSKQFVQRMLMKIWDEDNTIALKIVENFKDIKNDFSALQLILGNKIEDSLRDELFSHLCKVIPADICYHGFIALALKEGRDVSAFIERCSTDKIQKLAKDVYFKNSYLRSKIIKGEILVNNAVSIKELLFYALLKGHAVVDIRLDLPQFKNLFWDYIKDMNLYISNLYRPELLTDEGCEDLPELYSFIYLCHQAFQSREQKGTVVYINYLKKAIQYSPDMSYLIERLIQDVEREFEQQEKNIHEFNEYADKVKRLIKDMIRKKNISAAKEAILSYEKVNPSDKEIIKLKEQVGIYIS